MGVRVWVGMWFGMFFWGIRVSYVVVSYVKVLVDIILSPPAGAFLIPFVKLTFIARGLYQSD